MCRTILIRVSAGILVSIGSWVAYTQNQKAPPQLNVLKVKDDLYTIEGDGGNVAVYVTGEGLVLVDDKYERDFNEIMAKVKSISNLPVRYVLNTHQHDDHSGGNSKMMAGSAEVIAHRNARINMVALKQPGQPRVTFTDQIELNLGGKEVRARYYGRGHTNGDAVIYFPALKVIHTGDLFLTNPPLPFIDYANGGSAVDWTGTLDEILKIDFDTVIPGHGPLSNRAGVVKWRADFEAMRNRIGGLVRQGKGKEEVSKALVSEFNWPPAGLAIAQVDAFIAEMKR